MNNYRHINEVLILNKRPIIGARARLFVAAVAGQQPTSGECPSRAIPRRARAVSRLYHCLQMDFLLWHEAIPVSELEHSLTTESSAFRRGRRRGGTAAAWRCVACSPAWLAVPVPLVPLGGGGGRKRWAALAGLAVSCRPHTARLELVQRQANLFSHRDPTYGAFVRTPYRHFIPSSLPNVHIREPVLNTTHEHSHLRPRPLRRGRGSNTLPCTCEHYEGLCLTDRAAAIGGAASPSNRPSPLANGLPPFTVWTTHVVTVEKSRIQKQHLPSLSATLSVFVPHTTIPLSPLHLAPPALAPQSRVRVRAHCRGFTPPSSCSLS
ncbi:hypothetical protein J6590_043477 [Homalodisca vitripennis]|nr:hypothetical protein J6590_043477 [Homalodisca vitripennis]